MTDVETVSEEHMSADIEPSKSVEQRKLSSRLQNQHIVKELQQTIENMSHAHKATLQELKSKSSELCYERLQKLHDDLSVGYGSLTQLHDTLKKAESNIEDTQGVKIGVDRVTADYRYVIEQIENRMSSLSVKSKHAETFHKETAIEPETENIEVVECLTSEKMPYLEKSENKLTTQRSRVISDQLSDRVSIHSKSSRRSRSLSSCSHRSSRSGASSKSSQSLRVMQAEARATAATKQAHLEAEMESQQLEEKSLQLEN